MSSLTTDEEIQKQLTVIFGFSGREEIQCGDILGVGKLTKQKMNELTKEVLRYLNSYNGMLRDYAGTEIFAIEFELKNFSLKKDEMRLLPQAMILIPGEYKDSNTLLLALTKESSLLDVHKARDSILDLGKIFFEIEEVVERPELRQSEKKEILNKFASRFARKVQGELIEGKWNKKLVGIKTLTPTEQENLHSFITIQPKFTINWKNHLIKDTIAEFPKFIETKPQLPEGLQLEFQKWSISGPSGFHIAQNTLQLGSQLLRIANTGSVNETQVGLVQLIMEDLVKRLSSNNILLSAEDTILEIKKYMRIIKDNFAEYVQIMENFLISGYKGSQSELVNKIKTLIQDKNQQLDFFTKIVAVQEQVINFSLCEDSKSIRANELKPCLDYLIQTLNLSQKLIESNLDRYFSYIYLCQLYKKLLDILVRALEAEEKPARVLGHRFIIKFAIFLLNKINEIIINDEGIAEYNKLNLENLFKKTVQFAVDNFIDEVPIYIEDLIGFAEVMLGDQAKKVQGHLDSLKKVRSEFSFLLSFLLRNSTWNRFLKDLDEKHGLDPVTLANSFVDFMRKRIGALNLYWKEFILDVAKEYGQIYQKQYEEEEKKWSRYKIINDFLNYLKTKITDLTEPDKFKEVLDQYIGRINEPTEQALMILLFEQYEYSINIKNDFPEYVKQRILKSLGQMDYKILPKMPQDYLKSMDLKIPLKITDTIQIRVGEQIESTLGFHDFLYEFELKYFSKLIARPVNVLLKSTDNANFSDTLYYNLNFKYWEKFFKMTVSNNWIAVRSKF